MLLYNFRFGWFFRICLSHNYVASISQSHRLYIMVDKISIGWICLSVCISPFINFWFISFRCLQVLKKSCSLSQNKQKHFCSKIAKLSAVVPIDFLQVRLITWFIYPNISSVANPLLLDVYGCNQSNLIIVEAALYYVI